MDTKCTLLKEGAPSMDKEGVKADQEKCRMDLIPPAALWALGEVYTHGAQKYADRNWERGISFSRIIGALKRHTEQFELGENTDVESRQLHMASVAWCAMTLMHFVLYYDKYQSFDDRVDDRRMDVRARIAELYDKEHAPMGIGQPQASMKLGQYIG